MESSLSEAILCSFGCWCRVLLWAGTTLIWLLVWLLEECSFYMRRKHVISQCNQELASLLVEAILLQLRELSLLIQSFEHQWRKLQSAYFILFASKVTWKLLQKIPWSERSDIISTTAPWLAFYSRQSKHRMW